MEFVFLLQSVNFSKSYWSLSYFKFIFQIKFNFIFLGADQQKNKKIVTLLLKKGLHPRVALSKDAPESLIQRLKFLGAEFYYLDYDTLDLLFANVNKVYIFDDVADVEGKSKVKFRADQQNWDLF